MKPKTQEYVQFIKENHKDFGEGKYFTGLDCASSLGISQGRVSQLLKAIKAEIQPVNQEAAASTAEA